MTAFSDQAWEETAELRRRIHELPFNTELTAGTLSQARFRFYVIQDALYLTGFSRALAVAAAKAPDAEAMQRFASASHEALAVERALHKGFFEKFGIDPQAAAATPPSPTCTAYTDFLTATAYGSGYPELVAAVLPCFWIYWDVGKHIADRAAASNPYQAWIDTYSDPEFGESVKSVIAIADRVAEKASDDTRRAMIEKFVLSTRYEWMFWDSAYRLEDWPV